MRTSPGKASQFYDSVVLSHYGNDCLPWPFHISNNGYPRLNRRDGKSIVVSRRLCEEENGPPPSPGHDAAHSCGNRVCVARRHLSWKTRAENEADKVAHGTHNAGERHGMAKLTKSQVEVILALKGKEPPRKIADRFFVSTAHIRRIQRRVAWNSVRREQEDG